jgi:hypothetical protein
MEKCSVFVFVSLGVDGVVTNFTGLDPLSSQGDTKKMSLKSQGTGQASGELKSEQFLGQMEANWKTEHAT